MLQGRLIVKYILWGRGVDAERFYYQYRDKIDILFCVDSNWSGQTVRKP